MSATAWHPGAYLDPSLDRRGAGIHPDRSRPLPGRPIGRSGWLHDPEARWPQTRAEWIGLVLDVVVALWAVLGIVAPFVLL